MTATPITSKLGPEQARIRDLLRRLAEATSTEAPILSVYTDLRPQARGERPGERNELTVVRDRLNSIADTLDAHGQARTSFDANRARIVDLLAGDDAATANGIAAFACDHIGLWEWIAADVEFDTQVSSGPTAELFKLARLLDASVAAVVAIVDTSTCRLFVTRHGGLVERRGPDEPPDEHRRTDVGGWSQARFQRHVDMQDKRFAKEAADAIARLVERERARHVILAGHERAIGILEPELPEPVRALVDRVARIQMRTGADEVRQEVAPILAALDEAEGTDVADRAVAGARAGDLGVAGIDATMAALEAGQVDELVLDETASIDEAIRAELVRQAALTAARVEVVNDHPGLRRFDGVAATLRYRL